MFSLLRALKKSSKVLTDSLESTPGVGQTQPSQIIKGSSICLYLQQASPHYGGGPMCIVLAVLLWPGLGTGREHGWL